LDFDGVWQAVAKVLQFLVGRRCGDKEAFAIADIFTGLVSLFSLDSF
jgi:hypothetical protein